MEATLDQFGRIVIPKEIREDFGLDPGSILVIEETQEEIILKPLHGEPHLVDKGGVMVFSGASAGNIEKSLQEHREKRLRKLGFRMRGQRRG